MYTVDDTLTKQADGLEGRERLIAVHGNRFILFCVFSNIDLTKLTKPATNLGVLKGIPAEVGRAIFRGRNSCGLPRFSDSYPGNLFQSKIGSKSYWMTIEKADIDSQRKPGMTEWNHLASITGIAEVGSPTLFKGIDRARPSSGRADLAVSRIWSSICETIDRIPIIASLTNGS